MLERITFSGADDGVDPDALIEISRAHPYVEWGILCSTKRRGTARYPSEVWIAALAARAFDAMKTLRRGVQLSAHFCGEMAREVERGERWPLPAANPSFQRVQLNGIKIPAAQTLIDFLKKSPGLPEVILQVPTLLQLIDAQIVAERVPCIVSALFDPSAGQGLAPKEPWPALPSQAHRKLRVGYAGGINPTNVVKVLAGLRTPHREQLAYWIDMESGIRTEEKFDLEKVREVIRLAEPFVSEMARGKL